MSARNVDAAGCESGAAAFDPIGWLYLAAMPVFALMALLTGLAEATSADVLCMSGHGTRVFPSSGTWDGALSLTGMVPMYLLMSAFHAGPWIRLILAR